VYDEAQQLQSEHVAASGPAKLANPNSQAWYMGSGGMSTSVNAWRMRRRALVGNGGRFAYVEHTAEDLSLQDGRIVADRPEVTDRDAWARANPAYGRRIEDEKLEDLLAELGDDLFGRECLCLWDPEPAAGGDAIDLALWSRLTDGRSEIEGPMAFGYDVGQDRMSACIAACGRRSDGDLHVEVFDHLDGTRWLVKRIPELRDKWSPLQIAVDPGGPAGAVLPALEDINVDVERHRGQAELNAAVAAARKKRVGDAWRWERHDGTDLSPLYAATIARYAFLTAEAATPEPWFATS
jgi:hypothetical protein